MLSSPHRLRKQADFQQLYREGKTVRTKFFRIQTRKNSHKESRFAVIISNKVSKRAVIRNKKRRQIRAILRQLLPKIQTGYDVAVIAQPAVLTADFGAMQEDLFRGFEKIGFLHQ